MTVRGEQPYVKWARLCFESKFNELDADTLCWTLVQSRTDSHLILTMKTGQPAPQQDVRMSHTTSWLFVRVGSHRCGQWIGGCSFSKEVTLIVSSSQSLPPFLIQEPYSWALFFCAKIMVVFHLSRTQMPSLLVWFSCLPWVWLYFFLWGCSNIDHSFVCQASVART